MAMRTQTATRSRSANPSGRVERYVRGVPARFMAPRLVFVGAVILLVLFGLMMIYSSSAITALTSADSDYDGMYYFYHQAIFAGLGAVLALVFYRIDYHVLLGPSLWVFWIATFVLLVLTYTPLGVEVNGATRWIGVGSFTIQPSEFAKITIILAAAYLLNDYYVDKGLSLASLVFLFALGIVIPCAIILFEPDKGTFAVLGATLVLMLYFAGAKGRTCLAILLAGVLALAVYALLTGYSRERILAMLNPDENRYGNSYQLVQGFYALGSGGIRGVGLGMSKQKYGYIPEAYTDFIFSIIGEELGLIGTLTMLGLFMALFWAGMRIARLAPDISGRLIAAGSTFILVIQMFLNVCGVLGMFPLSGKPIPFISYGGSSVVSSLLLSMLVVSVSHQSRLPETEYERRRSDWSVTSAPRAPRAATMANEGRRLTVLGGGRQGMPDGARVSTGPNGRTRIDLGPSPSERLRPQDGPRTASGSSPALRGDAGRRRR